MPKGELFREAMLMQQVSSAFIIKPLGASFANPFQRERPYIVMEYFEAEDGEALLRPLDGGLPLKTVLETGLQVAQALTSAHAAGLCHLDLKPANLLIRTAESSVSVKVIDFGLARVIQPLGLDEGKKASGSGKSMLAQSIFGTQDYAPPEQMGERPDLPGPKSDIYAFGMTLARLATGKHPRRIKERDLPEPLRDLWASCTEDDPNARPSSQDLAGMLDALTPSPASTTFIPPAPPSPPSPLSRKRIEGEPLQEARSLQKPKVDAQPPKTTKTIQLPGNVPLEMAWIPPGEFMMGASPGDNEAADDEKPAHKVRLTEGFWMGKYTVTQEQWKAVAKNAPLKEETYKTEIIVKKGGWFSSDQTETVLKRRQVPALELAPSHFKGEDLPVECVSWDDVQEFLKIAGQELRLPTEAQWEYAVRGGTKGARYGNLDEIAWYADNSGSKTHSVGQKKANAFGLYDCLGNVWELCPYGIKKWQVG